MKRTFLKDLKSTETQSFVEDEGGIELELKTPETKEEKKTESKPAEKKEEKKETDSMEDIESSIEDLSKSEKLDLISTIFDSLEDDELGEFLVSVRNLCDDAEEELEEDEDDSEGE